MVSARTRQVTAGGAMLLGALPCAAFAATAPGVRITNQAAFSYTVDGEVRRGASNEVTLVVAERLDVGVGGTGATVTTQPTPVPATVTNMGTGAEAYELNVGVTAGLKVELVALDENGDGRFEAGVDRPLAGETPVLAPGETATLVALVRPEAAPVDGALTIAARARTGSGQAQAVFAGRGDDGGDAVVGPTGAAASAQLPLVAAADAPRLAKSQSVRAPDGSSRAGPGAVVTYTLVATFPAGAAAGGARIDDPVPAGTRYLPGTLMLDGARLTDAADDDAGACDGRAIGVALGDVAAGRSEPATRTVVFQVQLP